MRKKTKAGMHAFTGAPEIDNDSWFVGEAFGAI